MNSSIKAVIFDLDGLLIDSEPLWTEGRNIILREFGVSYSLEDKKKTMGGDYHKGLEYVIDRYSLPLTVKEFEKRERRILDELELKKLKFMPSAQEFLKLIDKAKVLRAIATSAFRPRLEFVKNILNLSGFAAEVTGEEIENGKPAPDIFLKVAEKLSVGPKDSVVLEDSKYGVKGAKAAVMKAVAVVDKRFSDDADFTGEYKPDLIVHSLKELSVEGLRQLFK